MTFLELYGAELTRELGNDVGAMFTVARRKAAINAAQLEFVKRTECLKRNTTIPLETGTQEYDLEETVSDFGWIAKQGVSIRITASGGAVRYLQGEDLIESSIERLDAERQGWRAESTGTPDSYYVDPDGGAINLGLVPAPRITAGDTWELLLPYVALPTDLSRDTDEPFTVSGHPMKRLRFWHRALVHFAAYDLEKFRKDVQRGAAQLQLFEIELQKYTAATKPKQGERMRMATLYRGRARRTLRDPRVWP